MVKYKILITVGIIVFSISSSLNANEEKYTENSYIMKGAQAEEDHKYKEAVLFYQKAMGLNPRILELYNKVGYIYQYELNDIEKAIEIYLRGLEFEHNEYALNLNIMYAYFSKKDINNGIKYYKILSSIRKDKKRFSFPKEIVDSILKAMNEKQILTFCEEYLTINPTDIILRNILVDIYMKRRKYKIAKEQFDAMIKYGYIDGKGYFGLAVCNYYIGEYKESLNNFTKAKELGEDVPEKYIYMVNEKIGLTSMDPTGTTITK